MPENCGKHCWEWPACKTESAIKLLFQENSKPQDLIVYTDGPVTKDQWGWGFTVKQDMITIHEDGAASTVSATSLTMEVDKKQSPIIHWIAWRGDNSQTTHTIIFTDLMSLLQKVEWEAQTGYVTVSHPPSETPVSVLPWTCTPEMTEQIDCWQSNHHKWFASQEIWSVEEFETLHAGRHKAKDITPPIAWRREAWKEEALHDAP